MLIGSGSTASHLYTERDDFVNFHLRAEVRLNEGGNSGLVFRSTFGPKWPPKAPGFPYGYEAHIANDNVRGQTGSLFVMDGGKMSGQPTVRIKDALVPPGDWCTVEVIAQDHHIEIKVNGQTVVSRDHSRFTKGRIAIQQIEPKTVVEFRKIEIKELPGVAPIAEAPQHVTPTPGFVTLFNGRDLTGWQTRPDGSGDWHVENGILSGSQLPGASFLYSKRGDYKDFHLKVEARIKDKENTALWFRTDLPAADARDAIPKVGYKIDIKEEAVA